MINEPNENKGAKAAASVAAVDDRALLKRKSLARAVSLSPRTIDTLQRNGTIPFIRLSPRCVRFSLPTVLRALARFEVKEVK